MKGIEWKTSPFGPFLIFEKPTLADIVIVSAVELDGFRPRAIKLPHQLYPETIRMFMGSEGIALQPARALDRVVLDMAALKKLGVIG